MAEGPDAALAELGAELRRERSVISDHVADTGEHPHLGRLAAAGPRAEADPAAYAVVVEAVREGYLLHYGEPRLLRGHDADLALLAGDYLYARGIERLAALGDAEAVHELSELISIAAECHVEDRAEIAAPLWLATAVAVGCGGSREHESAKAAARRLEPQAEAMLWGAARSGAASAGLGSVLDRTAESIDFGAPRTSG